MPLMNTVRQSKFISSFIDAAAATADAAWRGVQGVGKATLGTGSKGVRMGDSIFSKPLNWVRGVMDTKYLGPLLAVAAIFVGISAAVKTITAKRKNPRMSAEIEAAHAQRLQEAYMQGAQMGAAEIAMSSGTHPALNARPNQWQNHIAAPDTGLTEVRTR